MCRKLIYVCSSVSNGWTILQPPDDNNKQFIVLCEPLLEVAEYVPKAFQNILYNSTAVWESKIYFLGGLLSRESLQQDEPVYSNAVYAFNTVSLCWSDEDEGDEDKLASMGTARNPFVSVAVSPGKIYVFGGHASEDPKEYGECYNITSNSWNYLDPPPEEINWMGSHAVYHSTDAATHCIFFYCTGDRGIVTFNLKTDKWMPVDTTSNLYNSPFWNEGAVAVVDDVMYWLHRGTVFAHNFIKDETLQLLVLPTVAPFHLFQEKDTYGLDSYLCDRGPDMVPSYLFHVGNSRLCLVWNNAIGQNLLHCCSFLIKRPEEDQLGLEIEHCQNVSFPSYQIIHASLVSVVS